MLRLASVSVTHVVIVTVMALVAFTAPALCVAVAGAFTIVVFALGVIAACKTTAVVVVIHSVTLLIAAIRFVVSARSTVPVSIVASTAYIVAELFIRQAIPVIGCAIIAKVAVAVVLVAVVGSGVVVAVRIMVIILEVSHTIRVISAAVAAVAEVFTAVLRSSRLKTPLRIHVAVVGIAVKAGIVAPLAEGIVTVAPVKVAVPGIVATV